MFVRKRKSFQFGSILWQSAGVVVVVADAVVVVVVAVVWICMRN